VVGGGRRGPQGRGELLLEVVAAGVNRADLVQREGRYPPRPGAPGTLGLECSGTVAALGDGTLDPHALMAKRGGVSATGLRSRPADRLTA